MKKFVVPFYRFYYLLQVKSSKRPFIYFSQTVILDLQTIKNVPSKYIMKNDLTCHSVNTFLQLNSSLVITAIFAAEYHHN